MSPVGSPTLITGLLLGALTVAACSPHYAQRVGDAHRALSLGDVEAAEAALEDELAHRAPQGADRALLLLELGTLKLMRGAYDQAAECFRQADPALEVIDIGAETPKAVVTSHLFDGSSAKYRAPPHEKQLVNLFGVAARLAANDLTGATVEARRYDVMERYLSNQQLSDSGLDGLGQWLHRWAHSQTGRRVRKTTANGVAESPWWIELGHRQPVWIVELAGRAPHRKPVSRASSDVARRARLSDELTRASRVSGTIATVGLSAEEAAPEVAFSASGATSDVVWSADVSATVRSAFASAEPRLSEAAYTRAATRRTAGRASTQAGKKVGVGGWVGQALNVTLGAYDRPDTRAWTTLPAAIRLHRMHLPPGEHRLSYGVWRRDVVVRAGKPALVVVGTHARGAASATMAGVSVPRQ